MDYFNAFWTGGLICALVQILLDKTKLLPGRVMVLLVCSGALLSFLGLYQPFVNFAGAGATVPLLPCSVSDTHYGKVCKKQFPKMAFLDYLPVVLLPAPSGSLLL